MGNKTDTIAEPSFEILEVMGGIHPVKSIEAQPNITLRYYRVFEVSSRTWHGERTRHFVGYNVTDGEGRVSTPIKQFDRENKKGQTSSRRVYQLAGPSGFDRDALYVWDYFVEINGITDIVDVTEQYE